MTTYRQIAHRLRIQGRVPEDSERPREQDYPSCYHDEPCRHPGPGHRHPTDAPLTLIELDESDRQTQRMLRTGAIVPHAVKPQPLEVAAPEEDEADG